MMLESNFFKKKMCSITHAIILISAFSISSMIMNRWVLSEIGLYTLGRVWQLFVSWEDYGFFRRGLIGTLLSTIELRQIFSNDYHYALFTYHFIILSILSIIFCYTRIHKINNATFLFTVFLSPALLFQLSYVSTSLDSFVFLFVLVNMLFVRNVSIFCLVIIAGILTHELFFFTVPAQMLAWHLRTSDAVHAPPRAGLWWPAVTALAAMLIVSVYGKMDIAQGVFERDMVEKMRDAANWHPMWSGYFELNTSAEQNLMIAIEILKKEIKENYTYLAIPLAYVFILALRVRSFMPGSFRFILILTVSILPLSVSLIAYDYYRWIGFTCNLLILFTLIICARQNARATRFDWWLVPFSILGPLGNMPLNRPFPMLQSVFERLL